MLLQSNYRFWLKWLKNNYILYSNLWEKKIKSSKKYIEVIIIVDQRKKGT